MATINGTFLPDILLGTGSTDTINGFGGNDALTGFGGDDFLDGGAGDDTLVGGSGNDTYTVTLNAGDRVNYSLLPPILGIDLLPVTVVEVLGDTARIEVSLLGGGSQILDVDLNLLQITGETIVEADNEGSDTLRTNVSFDLADGISIEDIRTTDNSGITAISLAGNNIDNTVVGNAGANLLIGEGGSDTLYGLAGDDTLQGGEGNDVLEGGLGNDMMAAGAGSDAYYVDQAGDQVLEAVNEGSDRVSTSISYALAAGSEVEVLEARDLTGTAALDLTGNEFSNIIIGNAGSNILRGGGGSDILKGGAGDDFLIGDAGDDLLHGDAGNDTYYVDDASDRVSETAGQGYDRVATSGSYTLDSGSEIELLEAINLTDTTALVLTGNELANRIVGNAGNNYLIGGGGADVLDGNAGNDTFYVSDSRTLVIENLGGGDDRVSTSVSLALLADAEVETLEVTNLSAIDTAHLTGSDFGNRIIGNAGTNNIDGRGGADILTGGDGADNFLFTTAIAGGVDTITDFASGLDYIVLDDAIFAGLAPGDLGASAFAIGTQAMDADDRVIYDHATGALMYDADGFDGAAAVQFAILGNGSSLAASDFLVI